MTRGMTLLETLLSVTLLASVVVAVGGWMELAARSVPQQAAHVRWRAAAERSLALINNDLMTGDFVAAPESHGVEVGNGRVLILTREPGTGSVTHRYEVEHDNHHLVRVSEWEGRTSRRVLVGDASSLTADLDEEKRRLVVLVRSVAGTEFKRAFDIPKERIP